MPSKTSLYSSSRSSDFVPMLSILCTSVYFRVWACSLAYCQRFHLGCSCLESEIGGSEEPTPYAVINNAAYDSVSYEAI